MESLFDKISKNIKKGMEEGIAVLKEGANVVSVKMNELSAEGKRQYKIFNLNLKIQDQMNELGGITYAVLDGRKSLDENKKIKAAFAKIKKLEWQLSKIGGKRIKAVSAQKPTAKEKMITKRRQRKPPNRQNH
jgi:lipopolysaccharide export LptBFGC system permease protein LptF